MAKINGVIRIATSKRATRHAFLLIPPCFRGSFYKTKVLYSLAIVDVD